VSPTKNKRTTRKKKNKPMTAAQARSKAMKAAAIVSQTLVHFGSGYGSTRAQIFAKPEAARKFSDRLMKSTMKYLKELDWDNDKDGRDRVCYTAYVHGRRARKAAAGKPLTWKIIKATLDEVKTAHCPPGGGLVCIAD